MNIIRFFNCFVNKFPLFQSHVQNYDSTGKSTTYIFDHIFKSGGTTFNLSYLPAAFREDERFIIRGNLNENRKDIEQLIATEYDKKRFKIIAGHNAGDLRPYFPNAKFITLVRNPTVRAISGYLHSKFHPDAFEIIGKEINERNIGLAQFIEEDLFSKHYANFVSLHNWQAKVLLGKSFNDIDLMDEVAVTKVIRSRFYLVGYTEAFNLFILYLHITEGFPLLLFNNRLVRKERRNVTPTIEEIKTIEHFNKTDMTIYQYVKKDFDRRISEIWNDNIECIYTLYINALKRFRYNTVGDVNKVSIFKY